MLPTSTDVTITTANKTPKNVDAVVTFVTEQTKSAPDIQRLLDSKVLRGKHKEIAFDLVTRNNKTRRVYGVGVGPAEKLTAEKFRESAGALARALKKHRITHAAIIVPNLEPVPASAAADAIVTGLLLASFNYTEQKGTAQSADEKKRQPLNITIISPDRATRAAADRAAVIADAQNYARTIASRPGNVINPPTLARAAQQLAKEVGLQSRILDEKQMARLGMGGILGVGQGSATPPRMIVLEHRSKSKAKSPPLLVVGKSMTFDAGGISIKPAADMGDMIFDKCGGMAVLGLMCAVAKLKLPINVVGILSSAENLPSGSAYRPGDILRMYNGVTVEVTDTDAEGRLVLGDALAWGIETYKPAAVIDLATLTSGVVWALGTTMAGVMCNTDALMTELQKSADVSGEKIWRLPVGEDQLEQIKSQHADIINYAGRWASPLQGEAFLSHFVPQTTPWAHFDIAGVADISKDLPYYTKGTTGWGVRTLVEWVTSRITSSQHATPRPAGG